MSDKPNCWECKHRGSVTGSAHIRCNHPEAAKGSSPMSEVMGIFASVGRVAPVINGYAASKMGVSGNLHGIMHGWFNWPFNFDPVWLESCNGFEPKEKTAPRQHEGEVSKAREAAGEESDL
jgi:hypothetical protein